MRAASLSVLLGLLLLSECGRVSSDAPSTAAAGAANQPDGAAPPQRTLGDVLSAGSSCADGELAYATDADGDHWAYPDADVLCSATPLAGHTLAADIIGFDCNDSDPTLTRQVYLIPASEPAAGIPAPDPQMRCQEDPDTAGFAPLASLAAIWSGYNCPFYRDFQAWGRDSDGDGAVARSHAFLCVPSGETPEGGFASGLYAPTWEYQDCDDGDPTQALFGFTDQDGDGYTLGGPRCIVPGAVGTIGVGASLGDDCDDADAALFQLAYVDADGDGARSDRQQCVGVPLPDGVLPVTSPVDCDDSSASVHPGALETAFGDGIDQDCDGADAPACDALASGSKLAGDASCATQVDLSVVWARGCPDALTCNRGALALSIGNLGSAPFAGPVTVSWTQPSGSVQQTLELSLAAGESSLLQVPNQQGGSTIVSLLQSVPDCHPENDSLSFQLAGGLLCKLD